MPKRRSAGTRNSIPTTSISPNEAVKARDLKRPPRKRAVIVPSARDDELWLSLGPHLLLWQHL